MSRKTKNLLKLISLVIILVLVFTELGIIVIPALVGYKFWLSIIAYFTLFLSSL